MTEDVSHRAFTSDSQVKFQACQCEVYYGNNGTGKDCFISSAVCLCPYFSNKYSIIIFVCILFLPEGQNAEAWTTSKNKVLLKIGEHWLENIFPFFYLGCD
jgi:predicted ATPase